MGAQAASVRPGSPPGGDAGHANCSYYQGLLFLSLSSCMCTLSSILLSCPAGTIYEQLSSLKAGFTSVYKLSYRYLMRNRRCVCPAASGEPGDQNGCSHPHLHPLPWLCSHPIQTRSTHRRPDSVGELEHDDIRIIGDNKRICRAHRAGLSF